MRPGQRLREQNSFKNLVEKGSFARGRFFYVWVALQQEAGIASASGRPVVGIVVNRKTQARATDRNKLKRRAREIFRKWQNEIKNGVAVLIKAREGSILPDSQSAERELVELFKKTGAME